MPTDDTTDPMAKPEVAAEDEAGDADVEYQEAFDAAADGRKWVLTCMAVLTAEIDLSGYDPMSLDAVRAMRVEAARRACRVLRSDWELPCPPDQWAPDRSG